MNRHEERERAPKALPRFCSKCGSADVKPYPKNESLGVCKACNKRVDLVAKAASATVHQGGNGKGASDPLLLSPAVKEYQAVFGFYPGRGLPRETIAARVADIPRWRQAMDAWRLSGHNPKNIAGQLDWYENGAPQHRPAGQPARHERKAVIPG